jgi:uncharacterized NAD(P)/FAD-binding protein YdhS
VNPLLQALEAQGLVQADPYGLGLAVDEDCRVIGSVEQIQPIFAIGPLTRGTFGELIGFPQITTQPRQAASTISALIEPEKDRRSRESVTRDDSSTRCAISPGS